MSNNLVGNESAHRLHVAVGGAVLVHALILVWLALPIAQTIMPADSASSPTRVSIRLAAPIKDTLKPELASKSSIITKMVKAMVNKPAPEMLNKIEPAAATHQFDQPESLEMAKPVRDVVPVISVASIKGRRVQPEYPRRSLRMRHEGVVWLHVLISENGQRQDIKIHKPSQYALLNQAALKAVKKWTFDPNVVRGRAVQSWVEIPIEFKIQ